MKTPDEIKKGLECCQYGLCNPCPYDGESCGEGKNADALALIQQFEADNAEKDKRIGGLEKEIAAVKRERDAAVKDISRGSRCSVCKKFFKNNDGVGCSGGVYCIPLNFEWRGVCPDTEAQGDEC